MLLKNNFDTRASELATKIGTETASVLGKLEENRKGLMEHAESLFTRKFTAIVGTLIGQKELPESMLVKLSDRNVIRKIADSFANSLDIAG